MTRHAWDGALCVAVAVVADIAIGSVGATGATGVTDANGAQDGQWLTYSGSYASHRFSPLTQISSTNVARLRPVWVYQPPGTGSVEATPVVAEGVMYVTSGPTNVAALDLESGKPIWDWSRPI